MSQAIRKFAVAAFDRGPRGMQRRTTWKLSNRLAHLFLLIFCSKLRMIRKSHSMRVFDIRQATPQAALVLFR